MTVLLKYIKIELDTDLKKILLNQDLINYIEYLNIDNATKCFNTLTSLNLHILMVQIILKFYLSKFFPGKKIFYKNMYKYI